MSDSSVAQFKSKVIKKYKNRKLYDKEESHYITLSDIKNFVVQGLKVTVKEDPQTKGDPEKDITLLTKIQILQDEAQKRHNAGQSIDFVSESELDAVIKKMKKEEVKVEVEVAGTEVPVENVATKVA